MSIVVRTWANTHSEEKGRARKNDGFGFCHRLILIDDEKARWLRSNAVRVDLVYLSLLTTRQSKSRAQIIRICEKMIDPTAIMYSLKCEHQCHDRKHRWIKLFYCFFSFLITSDNCLPMRTSERRFVFFFSFVFATRPSRTRCSPEGFEEEMCYISPSCTNRKISLSPSLHFTLQLLTG